MTTIEYLEALLVGSAIVVLMNIIAARCLTMTTPIAARNLRGQALRLPGVLRVDCYPGEFDDEITVKVQIKRGDDGARQQVYDLKWAARDRHPNAELDVWVVEQRQ